MSQPVHGYHGQYLRIDLTACEVQSIPIAPQTLRRFIGGTGLGTWLLLQESPDQVDALAPDSPIVFVFSPLVGSPLTTSAKFAVVGKSPLTGRINDSLSSSGFAIAGKRTGFDALLFVGKSNEPTSVVIDSDGVHFNNASDLWGRSSAESEELLRKQIGSQYQVAGIGPAGERLIHFATISHDGRHAGRGGLGAVMGSKNLKAIAVNGKQTTTFARRAELVAYSKDLSKLSMGSATAKYRELGTVSNLLTFNRLGTLPTRNFQSGTFEGSTALAPETVKSKRTRASCAACTIGCEHIFHTKSRPDGVRMEYQNLFAFGPLCGVSDSDTVIHASSLCDEFGMDTISVGASIAFGMECAERGLIDAPELRFGNGTSMIQMIQQIATKSGLGELLSRGTRAAAREIGQGSEDFAPHVKGLEIPGYDPRALQTMAMGFAVGTRGADHNRSGAYQVDFSDAVDRTNVDVNAVSPAIQTENESVIMDSLILCKFLRGVFEDRMSSMAHMLQLVTGWDMSSQELEKTAGRIVDVKKWYNTRQGWTPAEDTLPARFFTDELPDGTSQGAVLGREQLALLITAYNRARGWDDEGWIPQERLQQLGDLQSETAVLPT